MTEVMTPAQRVDHIRSQLRYGLQDSHDIWRDVHEKYPTAGERITAASLLLEAAIRDYWRAFELLLEQKP